MPEIAKDVKRLMFERNPKLCCRIHDTFIYLGVVFMLIGIVSDATNKVVGLEVNSWFIMAVGFWILGIFAWFRGYFSAKEGAD